MKHKPNEVKIIDEEGKPGLNIDEDSEQYWVPGKKLSFCGERTKSHAQGILFAGVNYRATRFQDYFKNYHVVLSHIRDFIKEACVNNGTSITNKCLLFDLIQPGSITGIGTKI